MHIARLTHLRLWDGARGLAADLRNLAGALVTRLYVAVECQAGQTMAEYAIVIAVIALIVIAAALFLGSSISTLFSSSSKHL